MSSKVNDDAWHHIAATWNLGGKAKLYVDGSTPVSVNHEGKNFKLDGSILLGRPNDNERYYIGLLDDVRVYDFALSSDEIQGIMLDEPLLVRPQPD
jgi:hypothetical protein